MVLFIVYGGLKRPYLYINTPQIYLLESIHQGRNVVQPFTAHLDCEQLGYSIFICSAQALAEDPESPIIVCISGVSCGSQLHPKLGNLSEIRLISCLEQVEQAVRAEDKCDLALRGSFGLSKVDVLYVGFVAEVRRGENAGDQGFRLGGVELKRLFCVHENFGTPQFVHLEYMVTDSWLLSCQP